MVSVDISIDSHGVVDGVEKEVDRMMGEFIAVVMSVYHKMFEGSRSGRLYHMGSFKAGQSRGLGIGRKRARGSGSRIHRASAPGEALARHTGKTMNAYSVRRLKRGIYRIRFGGGVLFWELRDNLSQRRPTLLPAIEKAAEIYFG